MLFSAVPINKCKMVEYATTLGISSLIVDKHNLYPYAVANELFSKNIVTGAFYSSSNPDTTQTFFAASTLDQFKEVCKNSAYVVISDNDYYYYYFVLENNQYILKRIKGTATNVDPSTAFSVSTYPTTAAITLSLIEGSSGVVIIKHDDWYLDFDYSYYSSSSLKKVFSDNAVLYGSLRYLGRIGNNIYFGYYKHNSENIELNVFKLDINDLDNSQVVYKKTLTITPHALITPSFNSFYRADGAIHVFSLVIDNDNNYNLVSLLIENSGGVNEQTFSFSVNSDDCHLHKTSFSTILSGISFDDNKLLFVNVFNPKNSYWNVNGSSFGGFALFDVDFTNGAVKLVKSIPNEGSPFKAIVPLNAERTKHYLLSSYGIDLLKLSSNNIIHSPNVDERDYLSVGTDSVGRIWGVTGSGVYVLPELDVNKYVTIEWEQSVYDGNSLPVDAKFTVKLYDSDGNRISGDVDLVIVTGNAVFKSTNTAQATVSVSDTTDTVVEITINNLGLVKVWGNPR